MVGTETADDAAVYQISEELAIIQTVDFFTPIADDPYAFGQIAAANALSDVYAMGGAPKIALNIAAFPNCLPVEILGEILRGGADKVKEAGAVLAGGHTIQDEEPKYGLCVTGFVHPQKMWKNVGAQAGDLLLLTKPLGNGILNTAARAELLTEAEQEAVIHTMALLNKYAAEAMSGLTVHACTDITGFGLAGHAMEMARGSNGTLQIHTAELPVFPGAVEYAAMGLVPAGTYRNREYVSDVSVGNIQGTSMEDIIFDPQTSGGLLAALPAEEAYIARQRMREKNITCAVIGQVVANEKEKLIFD